MDTPTTIREMLPIDAVGFAAWHAALAAGSLDGRAAGSIASLTEFADSLGSPSPVLRRLAVGAFRAGECVGAMLVELPLKSDLETVFVEIGVPVGCRRQGIGATLWDWAESRARAENRLVIQTEVNVPTGSTLAVWPGGRFALNRGFSSANVEDHLVADLPFDSNTLGLLDDGSRSDRYRIIAWTGACPEEWVQSWADLQTAMSSDVPTGSLAREPVVHTVDRVRLGEQRMADNWDTLSSLAVNADKASVGYSTIFVPKTQPGQVYQDDTLVLRAHRSHGLGTRLKVANLRQLATMPEPVDTARRWLHTHTEQGNAAMQTINARFGFRMVEELHELELNLAISGP